MAVSPLLLKQNIRLSYINFYERQIDSVVMSYLGSPSINENTNTFNIVLLLKKDNVFTAEEINYLWDLYIKAGWKTFKVSATEEKNTALI